MAHLSRTQGASAGGRARVAGLVIVAAALTACGGARHPTRASRSSLIAVNSPAANGIDSACGTVTSAARVLCPSWLPGGGSDQWQGGAVGTNEHCSYLVTLLGTKTAPAVPFHVMFGGRCRLLSLDVTKHGRWPERPDFTHYLGLVGETQPRAGRNAPPVPVRLRVIAHTTVRGQPALIVQVASYPNAGIQKGHYAIVWNEDGDGYALSYHYLRGDAGEPPTPPDVQALRHGAMRMVPLSTIQAQR